MWYDVASQLCYINLYTKAITKPFDWFSFDRFVCAKCFIGSHQWHVFWDELLNFSFINQIEKGIKGRKERKDKVIDEN